MNKTVVFILGFVTGSAAGGFAVYKLLNDRYAQIAQDEVDSVKEMYARKAKEAEDLEEKKELAHEASNKPDIMEYAKVLNEQRYKPEAQDDEDDPIEFIESNEYGLDDEYDLVQFTYYSDGVLADEDDEVVNHPSLIVGNFADKFEDNVVYVKNDETKTYYEIIEDDRTYTEVVGDEVE